MLRDLEQRESGDATQANYQPPAKKAVSTRLLLIIVVGIIAIGLTLFWPEQNSTPVAQSPVVQPINQSDSQSDRQPDSQSDSQSDSQPESGPDSQPANQVASPVQQLSGNLQSPSEPTPALPAAQQGAIVASSTITAITPSITVDDAPKIAAKPVVRSSNDPNKTGLKAQIADAIERNNANEAIRLLKTLILQQPDNTAAKKRLAALYFSEGRSEDAQRLLQETLSNTPSDSSVRLMYARLMAQKNEPDLAYYTLREADDFPPANIELLGFRASMAQQLNKPEEALADYRVLVNLDARNAKWWLGQAVVADKLGERKLAIDSYREAFALQSLDVSIQRFIQQRLQLLTGVAP